MTGSAALEVPPFDDTYGELKCWAVNPDGNRQISWNHLFGSATIYNYVLGEAWEYSSWNFAARNVDRGKSVGVGGRLDLNGAPVGGGPGYDACPQYVLGAFMADGAFMVDGGRFSDRHNVVFLDTTDLTLVPCIEDLRQDRTPTYTKAQFDIWNEDEVKFTGAYICFKCWLETTLDPYPIVSSGAGTWRNFDKFGIDNLHTTMGFFRVTGVASTVCDTDGSWSRPIATVGFPIDWRDFQECASGSVTRVAPIEPEPDLLIQPAVPIGNQSEHCGL